MVVCGSNVLVAVISAGLLTAGLVPALITSPAAATPFNIKHLNKIQRRPVQGFRRRPRA